MSVEVLVSKPAPTLTAPQSSMKEQVRPSSHSNRRSNSHQKAPGHPPPQPSPQYYNRPSGDVVMRSTQDTNGHNDIQHHFDHNHIIYDNTTDTTYLRGRLLGKGGFARCYEILNINTNKIYAGKIISKTRISKPHQKQKILREVQLQKNLKHRHVVEFNSYFEDDSNVYIILENCSRKSLVHVLKHRKCLTEPEVRYYLRQLVDGVDYIHGNQIIHRDLKLGNMLLNSDMELKLADFGLATKVDFAGEKKMTVCGTPNYIAPEVLQKKGHSFEADIWAVGCITYALLVGRPPFETTTLKETYLRITENNYSLPSSLSTSAKNLIRKCLHPEPTSRPTLHDILSDEFLTVGFLPHTLSPACCTAMPKFPSRYTSNRPMSYAVPPEPKSDPMGRLGNALSQMHLDSRSENLLEEKELEDIEKKSPSHSPTHYENIRTAKDTLPASSNNYNNDGGSGDRSRSPPQRDLSKTGSAAMLLNVLGSCLEHIPKVAKGTLAPVNAEITWVTKWVDYSNKYGFGFQLSSDALGVLFNDTSRIIMAPDGRAIQYYDVTGKLSAFTSDCVPEELERKTTLLQYFARYMDEHLIHGGDLEYSSYSDSISWSGSLFLKKWFRTAKAIVLYLSDGTLQVNFFDDHTKLILSNMKNEYLVTYIDQERSARTFNLNHIMQEGCGKDVYERMTFARSMLKNLVDIEGADI
ncbi:serine/threonine-protein kinase PLK1-like [Physella acuta]|uniref:serine/threonine-protein kinase PLK1-like n=1 Tax=Physella acuta TaxID=109671 RepID=UPI0027DE8FDC|nr:serine/threonine-protein kinase PLK1-like [Physella acuta]XP_059146036.1 serine/threonine-protein kinase PLK1-like [Physella acuta]XP_059146037.1 serine/threonine-protein kinase PLK1-like [Physella acuta]XP_059146038.1 serine/threonine-protein kinase PLK1-like [Physella acuta]XP_059146039.1 serine/threonine-protein kinase PLK1-like [Physella acuta]